MSAFFIAINRNLKSFDRTMAERMLAELDRFGSDGKELVVQNNFAIGYQRLWTVPEEVGERQPIYDQSRDLWLMFHGRIDNRLVLFERLAIPQDDSLTDAGLLLALYFAYGETVFKEIIGPFVFVLFHVAEQKIVAARDAMGGRYLVYSISDQYILIATYEMALVAHPTVSYKLNEEKQVRCLIGMADDVPASMIAGCTPLNPGQQLVADRSRHKLSTFYLPDPAKRIQLSSNAAYAAEFRRLLEVAVERRLRSIRPVGTMLSGGMDSVPISITAAGILKRRGQQLQSFSWVFDQHPEADERAYSKPVCEKYSIRPHWINCDKVWPQFDADTHCNPVIPFSMPYTEFNQALFRKAGSSGVGVLLSGIGGDMLYTGTESILYELLHAGRIRDLVNEFSRLLRNHHSKSYFFKHYLIAPLMRDWLQRRRLKQPVQVNYLTTPAQRLLRRQPNYLIARMRQSLRPEQYLNLVGAFEGEDAAYGKFMEGKYSLERRYPLRDRELVEFMLAVPSEQLFFELVPRPIVRAAFERDFSPAMLDRNTKTNFTSAIHAGVQQDKKVLEWFNKQNPRWQEIVATDYFDDKSDLQAHDNILKWRCGYYEFWKSMCYNLHVDNLG